MACCDRRKCNNSFDIYSIRGCYTSQRNKISDFVKKAYLTYFGMKWMIKAKPNQSVLSCIETFNEIIMTTAFAGVIYLASVLSVTSFIQVCHPLFDLYHTRMILPPSQNDFLPFFSMDDDFAYCNAVKGFMKCEYNPVVWRLFLNSSQVSLNCDLLHKVNVFSSVSYSVT